MSFLATIRLLKATKHIAPTKETLTTCMFIPESEKIRVSWKFIDKKGTKHRYYVYISEQFDSQGEFSDEDLITLKSAEIAMKQIVDRAS